MTPEQLKYSILKKAFSGQLISCEGDSVSPKVKAIEFDETPFDIPEDWFWSSLGNCCDMYTGNSISESVKKAKYVGVKEGYDYIATKDVTFEHTIEYDNGVRIPVNDDFRIAYSGSVLMCIEGGSAGRKIGILDRDVCFGNKLCSFNSAEMDNTYIYYYLQSHEFKAFFMDNMSGIIGGVSIKKLKDLPIPIPTVSEQKAIVAKIEELLPYVDRYAVAYEKLERFNAKFPEDMKKSILQYAIKGKLVEQRPEEGTAEELYRQIQDEKQKLIKEGKIKKEKPLAEITENEIPFDIPDSWKWVRLNDAALNIGDIDHKMPQKVDQGIPYISPLDFTETGIDYSHAKKISNEDYIELS
jgi:type I restriction enzyme S subunit